MRLLYRTDGYDVNLYSNDPLIFWIDGKFYDRDGKLCEKQDYVLPSYGAEEMPENYNDPWYDVELDNLGTDMPLARLSDCVPVREIDDIFGNYGFIDESGNYRIKPQYAYADNFTCGLACVNLKRTWQLSDDGRYYYRNHYGYIDQNGRTVIEFKYSEARPFNKYGVAWVCDDDGCYFIDTNGDRVGYFNDDYFADDFYLYDSRYIEFYAYDEDEDFTGLFDTKTRKIVFEPVNVSYYEFNEHLVMVDYGWSKEIYLMD